MQPLFVQVDLGFGNVIVSFKTDEDIDRLIKNLQKLRSAPIEQPEV